MDRRLRESPEKVRRRRQYRTRRRARRAASESRDSRSPSPHSRRYAAPRRMPDRRRYNYRGPPLRSTRSKASLPSWLFLQGTRLRSKARGHGIQLASRSHLENDDSLIVGNGSQAAKFIQLFEERIGDGLRRIARVPLQEFGHAGARIVFTVEVELVLNAIGEKQNRIARQNVDLDLFVFPVFEQADRHALRSWLDDFALAADEQRFGAGVRQSQPPCAGLPSGDAQGRILRVDLSFQQRLVQELQQLRGFPPARRERP